MRSQLFIKQSSSFVQCLVVLLLVLFVGVLASLSLPSSPTGLSGFTNSPPIKSSVLLDSESASIDVGELSKHERSHDSIPESIDVVAGDPAHKATRPCPLLFPLSTD